MPLTVRTNGSSSPNIIQASWFNDFLNLFTGQMTDQEVTFVNNLVLKAIGAAPSSALTATPAAGTALGVGVYQYVYTFVSPDGESLQSPSASMTTTTNNQAGSLSSIGTGPTGTTARNIYRTLVGGSTYFFVASLNDNTTTVYTDTATDASLSGHANPPAHPSFGGSLVIKDSTGAVKLTIYNDGTIVGPSGGAGNFTNLTVTGTSSLDNGKITTDGSGNATFANNLTIKWKDSGGTARTILTVDASNNTQLLAPASGAKLLLKDSAAVSQILVNSSSPQVEIANDLKVDGKITAASSINATGQQVSHTGSNSGTFTVEQIFVGGFKFTAINLNNYSDAAAQTLALPVAYTTSAFIFGSSLTYMQLLSSGSAQSINIWTALASGGGSSTSQTNVNNRSIGDINTAFDSVLINSGTSRTGTMLIIGF